MSIADFILEARSQSVKIDRAMAPLHAAHWLEWVRFRLCCGVDVGEDVEICDIIVSAVPVDKVEEI